MAIALVQFIVVDNNASGGTGISLAFSGNVTAGNVLCGFAQLSFVAPSSVTDTQGNTYSLVSGQTAVFTAVASSTGPCTVTFHGTPGGNNFNLLAEYSGATATVGLGTSLGTNVTAVSNGPITIASPPEAVVSFYSTYAGPVYTSTSGAIQQSGGGARSAFCHNLSVSASPYTETGSLNSNPFGGGFTSIVLGAGGPPPPSTSKTQLIINL